MTESTASPLPSRRRFAAVVLALVLLAVAGVWPVADIVAAATETAEAGHGWSATIYKLINFALLVDEVLELRVRRSERLSRPEVPRHLRRLLHRRCECVRRRASSLHEAFRAWGLVSRNPAPTPKGLVRSPRHELKRARSLASRVVLMEPHPIPISPR